MSEFIDRELKSHQALVADGFGENRGVIKINETLRLLEALKQAEEALKTCSTIESEAPFGTDGIDNCQQFFSPVKVEAALASIAALSKDQSVDVNKMVSGKGE